MDRFRAETAGIALLLFATAIGGAFSGSKPVFAKPPPDRWVQAAGNLLELNLVTGKTRLVRKTGKGQFFPLAATPNTLAAVRWGQGVRRAVLGIDRQSGQTRWSQRADLHSLHNILKLQETDDPMFVPRATPQFFHAANAGAVLCLPAQRHGVLQGVDMEKGTVRWQYPQNDSRFWWNSLHVESDCVIASEGARVLLLDRTNGRVRWSLQVRKKPGRFRVRVAVTPRRVLIGADRAGRARGVLVEVDRKTNVTRQTFQSPKGCELLVVHAEKAICREGDRLVARNVSKLDQVVWANRQMPWFDPGKRGVLYQHFLLTRTSALPVFDLRDGTSFLLFHHPRGRELHVPNLPVGVHKGKLLTADSRGILAWDLRRLAQRGSAEQGKWIWKARNSKLPARGGPYLAACLLVGDRLYLSVTLSRSPVF